MLSCCPRAQRGHGSLTQAEMILRQPLNFMPLPCQVLLDFKFKMSSSSSIVIATLTKATITWHLTSYNSLPAGLPLSVLCFLHVLAEGPQKSQAIFPVLLSDLIFLYLP